MLCMAILATAIKYLSMAILTVYSLPYELQAYTYLLYVTIWLYLYFYDVTFLSYA